VPQPETLPPSSPSSSGSDSGSDSSAASSASGGAGTGEIRMEGGRSPTADSSAKPPDVAPQGGSVAFGEIGAVSGGGSGGVDEASAREEDNEEEPMPKVEEWDPMGESDDGGGRRRRSKASSESASSKALLEGSSLWPTGYRAIYLGCGVSLVAVFLALCWPQLRRQLPAVLSGGAGAGRKLGGTPGARFRDIGARTSEEELGLVQAANRYDDDDDDML